MTDRTDDVRQQLEAEVDRQRAATAEDCLFNQSDGRALSRSDGLMKALVIVRVLYHRRPRRFLATLPKSLGNSRCTPIDGQGLKWAYLTTRQGA